MARTLELAPNNVRIRVTATYHREGSILEGTARAVCDRVRTELALDSDEPAERLAHLVRMAEASCFTMAALREPVSTELVATVNGTPVVARTP